PRDRLGRLGAARAHALRVGPALDESLQLGVLAGLRVDALDLLQADAQQLDLAGPLRAAGLQVRDLGEQAAALRPGRAVGGEHTLVRRAHERVERLALLGRRAQPQLVGLAVHREQVLR